MRNRIAQLRPVWFLALIGFIAVNEAVDAATGSGAPAAAVIVTCLVLAVLLMIPPGRVDRRPVTVAAPVRGRWVAINSPGSRVPSHGTRTNGQMYAVDVVRPSNGDAPPLMRRGLMPDRPEEYSCFGDPVFAVAAGTVTRVVDDRRDHLARNTWPAMIVMVTIEGLIRFLGGFRSLGGNHVIVAHDDGTSSVYAHLMQGSATMSSGERVEEGQLIARIGNTGNSSEPHLHVQLMEGAAPGAGSGVPMLWHGVVEEGEQDTRIARYTKPPKKTALDGFPPNAEIFRVDGEHAPAAAHTSSGPRPG